MKIIVTMLVLLIGCGNTHLSAQAPSALDLLQGGLVRTGDLTYSAELMTTSTQLPKFSEMVIAQNGVTATAEDLAAYSINRLMSVLQYWIAIVDSPARDAAHLQEILAERFRLNFSTGKIDSMEELAAWLAGVRKRVLSNTHTVADMSYTIVGENQYRMVAELDWEGVDSNGADWIGKSRHNWLVIDNEAERFARIVSIDVDMLVPFSPKPE
jgi:hypothetical protein